MRSRGGDQSSTRELCRPPTLASLGIDKKTSAVAQKLAVEDRRKAVEELAAEGLSNRSIAETLGVGEATVRRDVDASNGAASLRGALDGDDTSAPNGAPLDTVAAQRLQVAARAGAGVFLSMPRSASVGGASGNGSRMEPLLPPTKTSHAATLSDVGLTRDESSRYQKLAAMPAEHFEAAIANAKAAAGEVTTAFMLREAAGKPHVTNNSGENEWYTPPRFIEAARNTGGKPSNDTTVSTLADVGLTRDESSRYQKLAACVRERARARRGGSAPAAAGRRRPAGSAAPRRLRR